MTQHLSILRTHTITHGKDLKGTKPLTQHPKHTIHYFIFFNCFLFYGSYNKLHDLFVSDHLCLQSQTNSKYTVLNCMKSSQIMEFPFDVVFH